LIDIDPRPLLAKRAILGDAVFVDPEHRMGALKPLIAEQPGRAGVC
jgi:hypothetical protein